ncbi:MAG: phospholipid carrier-dependent glycosyltransferase, partial [Bryobacteraceae bacterium]
MEDFRLATGVTTGWTRLFRFAPALMEVPAQASADSRPNHSSAPGISRATPPSHGLRPWLILAAVWASSGAYLAHYLYRTWYPHDEGCLAEAALRVMHGQLPHRDYIELYTGGQAYLHAFAFKVFGMQLTSMRIMLFLFFLAWVPALYFVARELAPDWIAGLLTLLCVAWSVPNYTAAMPSWYTLFFATFGLAALMRYLRRPSPWWLLLAGLCGGLSFLIKSVALYFVGGVLVFFVYREQRVTEQDSARSASRSWFYSAFVGLCSLAMVLALLRLVGETGGPPEYLHFVLPGAMLATLLILREAKAARGGDATRFLRLFRMAAPFLAGFAVPVALFLLPYARAGALGAWFFGIFVL